MLLIFYLLIKPLIILNAASFYLLFTTFNVHATITGNIYGTYQNLNILYSDIYILLLISFSKHHIYIQYEYTHLNYCLMNLAFLLLVYHLMSVNLESDSLLKQIDIKFFLWVLFFIETLNQMNYYHLHSFIFDVDL